MGVTLTVPKKIVPKLYLYLWHQRTFNHTYNRSKIYIKIAFTNRTKVIHISKTNYNFFYEQMIDEVFLKLSLRKNLLPVDIYTQNSTTKVMVLKKKKKKHILLFTLK